MSQEPVTNEDLREWERIAVERAMDYGAALYVNPLTFTGLTAAERVKQMEARLREHLRAHPSGVAPSREFRISVGEMVENGKGATYYVHIDRPDRPLDAKPWDEGRISPFATKVRERAEIEAEVWRAFLNGDGDTSMARARAIVKDRSSPNAGVDAAPKAGDGEV